MDFTRSEPKISNKLKNFIYCYFNLLAVFHRGGLIVLKWVEIDVCIANNPNIHREEVLLDLVDKLVNKFNGLRKGSLSKEDYTWHYLWESCECNNKQNPCLVLRFYGEETDIETIKNEFEQLMIELKRKKADLFGDYWYGKHGKCKEEYNGEEELYGSKGWELVKKMLNFGSEIALELIKNEEPNKIKQSSVLFIDRYVHLFLNQIIPYRETDFLLDQFVKRNFANKCMFECKLRSNEVTDYIYKYNNELNAIENIVRQINNEEINKLLKKIHNK